MTSWTALDKSWIKSPVIDCYSSSHACKKLSGRVLHATLGGENVSEEVRRGEEMKSSLLFLGLLMERGTEQHTQLIAAILKSWKEPCACLAGIIVGPARKAGTH